MRNYHIISISEPPINLQGYQKVLINNIDQIVNHSADNVICACLEYQAKGNLSNIIAQTLSKLKPKAQLTISFSDFKKLCEDFLNSKVSTTQIFDSLKGKSNMLIVEDILALIDINTFKLVNINYNEYSIHIVIERIII